MERAENRELVRKQIDALPEGYRTVLVLRDIEGLDTEETANVLGLSVNATKIRLHRARQALRTHAGPPLQERGVMKCRELAEFLMDYVSGELPQESRTHFEFHLSKCKNCHEYLVQYRSDHQGRQDRVR